MSLKDLGYTPRQESERIVLDDGLRQRVQDARAALAARRREEQEGDYGLGSKVPELEDALVEAETAAEKAAVTFTCRALPRHQLEKLIASCPPTAEQLERGQKSMLVPKWDVDKFTPRLIAAALVEPETIEAEVVEMWEAGEWSDSIWDVLWDLAWNRANRQVDTRPTFGTGTKPT